MRRRGVWSAWLVLFFVAVPLASARSSWVRWEGRYFICWIPNAHWQVVESSRSIDISSPTGLATVSLAYVTNGPGPYSLSYVRRLALSRQGGLGSVRVLSQSTTFPTGGGGVGQRTRFIAVRLRDSMKVRGLLTAEVFNNSQTGSYGFGAYEHLAPLRTWTHWSPTLATIQRRIVVLHG
jgi:hypothetical protein